MFERLSAPGARRHIHPAIAFVGWTTAWAGLSFLLLWLINSGVPRDEPLRPIGFLAIPGAVALLVGWFSQSWSTVCSPILTGIILIAFLMFDESRNGDSQFAIDAGYQILRLATVVLVVASVIGAAIGVALARAFRLPVTSGS